MKPWRIVKIVLSALWLAVTLVGLIYWMVTLAYPWNTTNLWLVPLYLAFPLWAFLGAVLNKERPLLYLIIKTFVIVLVLIPVIGLGLFSGLLAFSDGGFSDGSFDDLLAVYCLSSETNAVSAYGKWDEASANDLFPTEIPENAEDVSFHYQQVSILTQFWQDSSVTLSFCLPADDFDALREEIRNRQQTYNSSPEPDKDENGAEVYWDWESFSGHLQVSLDPGENRVTYELLQYSFE